jgi:hypothetical protein
MSDLFHSILTRDDLAEFYIESHLFVRGTEPNDVDGLNRAGLVDRIERLRDAIKSRGFAFTYEDPEYDLSPFATVNS